MSESTMIAITGLRKEVRELAEAIKGDPKIAELRKRVKALNTLEELESQDITSIGSLLDFGNITPTSPSSNGLQIEPDEFYRKQPLEAAKLYLKKKGKPAALKEIMDGIRAGGGSTGSEDDLRTSLTRSTYQIAKVSDDFFGLVEFYEGAPRGRKKKSAVGSAFRDAVNLEMKDKDGNTIPKRDSGDDEDDTEEELTVTEVPQKEPW